MNAAAPPIAVARGKARPASQREPFWTAPLQSLWENLASGAAGLSDREARRRLARLATGLKRKHRAPWGSLLVRQFNSPIMLLLLAAAGLSIGLGEPGDAAIILVIVAVSGLLGFWQEKTGGDVVARLLALVQVRSAVLRGGVTTEIPIDHVVPGDLAVLNAGDIVPGDGRIIESRDLFVDEAALTGETFPVEKRAGTCSSDTVLARRTNSLFLGTHVVSGTATLLVVHTGSETELGGISATLRHRPETEFEHGVRRFGFFLVEVTLLLVLGIFAINVLLARPVLDSLLFALALAVGLTPQLLPAIISVNLAHGARRMAARRVVVKRLAAIENFGSMTVLCADKTGTLTAGVVRLERAMDAAGADSPRALSLAALNACFQSGYTNPMDPAILAVSAVDRNTWRKLDEEPYDFSRRRMSVLVTEGGDASIMITKGAVPNVLAICSCAEMANGSVVDLGEAKPSIEDQVRSLSERGWRVLAVAERRLRGVTGITEADEREMTFVGLLTFSDPLRPGIVRTLADLRSAGVALKIITGDHHLVALDISRLAGFAAPRCLAGGDLRTMSAAALAQRVNEIDVFAEAEPDQKERVIRALRQAGHVVGFLGDGINDASALNTADVGISVAEAADVAKEAADIVLLEKNLAVLLDGVREGRVTFANTSKYVFMATSANFGNMFSMAAASLFLPFLPLLPKQILLLNMLTDLPEMTIATDRVDDEWTRQPRRWDVKFIRRFMVTFGLLSSVFDLATFVVLLGILHVDPLSFRSAWFLESVISAVSIVLIIRTPRPIWRSAPSRPLAWTTAVVALAALVIPFTGIAAPLGFVPLRAPVIMALFAITLIYVICAETAKHAFYRRSPLRGAEPDREWGARRVPLTQIPEEARRRADGR